MWIYLLIGTFFFYALIKEREALGCSGQGIISGCKNENGKAVKGTAPDPGDDKPTLLNKIQLAASYNDRFVKWRSVFIISLLSTFLLWFILFKRVPSEWELVVVITVLMISGMAANNFYKFHLSNYIQTNINKSVDLLKG